MLARHNNSKVAGTAHSRKIGTAVLAGVVGVAAVAGVAFGIGSVRYEAESRPHTRLGRFDLGGLTHEQVAHAVDSYVNEKMGKPLEFDAPKGVEKLDPVTPEEAGLKFDKTAILASVKYDDFRTHLSRKVGIPAPEGTELSVLPSQNAAAIESLAVKLDEEMPGATPALAKWDGTSVKLTYEMGTSKIDLGKLGPALQAALVGDGVVKLPIQMGAKRIKDEDLEQVKTVIGRFATEFSSGPSRTNNIRVASHMLDGHVVMPGQKFSFNDVLGKRTEEKGFKRAGIFLNGHHDFDTGGGICQVSTTLYNTVLQAGLEVVKRQPHSMPVWYVPPGQDATVSYPQLDFSFRNTRKEPVAIATNYRDGRLEFLLLGAEKLPGKVTVVNKLLRSWGSKTVTEHNPKLRPGTTQVKQKGSSGREVASWRVITNGTDVKKESLGISHYQGGPKIIEVGPHAKAAPSTTPSASVHLEE